LLSSIVKDSDLVGEKYLIATLVCLIIPSQLSTCASVEYPVVIIKIAVKRPV
jgi:hypothetical protein